MLKQLIKFVGVGSLATGIQYFILVLLAEFMSLDVIIASTIGYLISSVFNYLLNYYFTFFSKENHTIAAIKFTTVAMVGLVLNAFIVYFTVKQMGLYYLVGQVMATLFVLLWNFTVNRYWTYNAEYTRS